MFVFRRLFTCLYHHSSIKPLSRNAYDDFVQMFKFSILKATNGIEKNSGMFANNREFKEHVQERHSQKTRQKKTMALHLSFKQFKISHLPTNT